MATFKQIEKLAKENDSLTIEDLINRRSFTPEEQMKLIKIAVKGGFVTMLRVFAMYFDFCFDRRPLVKLTTSMDTIRYLMSIEYIDEEVIDKILTLIDNGDDTDIKFLMDQIESLDYDTFAEMMEKAKPYPKITKILEPYSQMFLTDNL